MDRYTTVTVTALHCRDCGTLFFERDREQHDAMHTAAELFGGHQTELHSNVHEACPACGGTPCRVYSTEDQANAAADHAMLAATGYTPPDDEPWSAA